MTVTVPYNAMSSPPREPMFSNCCWCFPLRTGCFILGYFNVILNTFHILRLVMLTTYFGITTHGFDHLDRDPTSTHDISVDIEKPILAHIGVLLIVMLASNVIWLIVSIACLVGLHKNRPGPIRVYVAFASTRLMLALAWFIYIVMNSKIESDDMLAYIIDLVLGSYFIFVYYTYAVQLEIERQELQHNSSHVNPYISYIYPTIPSITDEKKVLGYA